MNVPEDVHDPTVIVTPQHVANRSKSKVMAYRATTKGRYKRAVFRKNWT